MYPNVTCNETYVGQTDRRIKESIMDHIQKETKIHIDENTLVKVRRPTYGKMILKSSMVIIVV